MSDVKVKATEHESYNTFTIIAFLLPIVGIILGIVYLSKDSAIDKKLGEHLVAFSIFISIAFWIVWQVFLSLNS